MAIDFSNYVANQQPSQPVSQGTGAAANLASGTANLASSYQTFLSLLTTQLKNQDPTAPLDANSFTQQLVQMTGVQQQLLTNQLLQTLVTNSGTGTGLSGAVGLIGKTVTAQSATSTLQGGQAQWGYNLASPASQATLSVTDSSGRAIWSGPASTAAGDHTFTWNGTDASGRTVPDGTYTLAVTALDANGATVTTSSSITGVAGAIAESNGQTMVTVGATQAPLSAITAVRPS